MFQFQENKVEPTEGHWKQVICFRVRYQSTMTIFHWSTWITILILFLKQIALRGLYKTNIFSASAASAHTDWAFMIFTQTKKAYGIRSQTEILLRCFGLDSEHVVILSITKCPKRVCRWLPNQKTGRQKHGLHPINLGLRRKPWMSRKVTYTKKWGDHEWPQLKQHKPAQNVD